MLHACRVTFNLLLIMMQLIATDVNAGIFLLLFFYVWPKDQICSLHMK